KTKDAKWWAERFRSQREVITPLVLRDLQLTINQESSDFSKKFIEELGLTYLCKLGQQNPNQAYDRELLKVFKALIDTKVAVQAIINHNDCIYIVADKVSNT
ncbi:hypothetical protein RFI_12245, partial [Reticulomyxa filosa]